MTRRLMGFRGGPAWLTLVRHGESEGNVADAEAKRAQADRLDLSARDADVELSDAGQTQAEAVAAYIIKLADDERPTLAVSSPDRRAAATAERALEGTRVPVLLDERLRERDLGQFDGLTGAGIRHLYGDEAERRKKVGKFYYCPPGGESWADVVLRVRSFLTDLATVAEQERVWLFTHQAVIMAFRYVLEGISEADLLEIDLEAALPNCSMTDYSITATEACLVRFADMRALESEPAPMTHEDPHGERDVTAHG